MVIIFHVTCSWVASTHEIFLLSNISQTTVSEINIKASLKSEGNICSYAFIFNICTYNRVVHVNNCEIPFVIYLLITTPGCIQ